MKPILLLESEESVIKDVTCSLKLVDIPVLSFWNVDEARRMALESQPELILARARVGDDAGAGVSLARALAGEKEGRAFPVVVLLTQSERGLIGEHRRLFVSEIGLPVEFPAFTRQVQKILTGLKTDAACAAVPAKETAAVSAPCADRHDRNMLIAFEIQHRVMDLLRKDGRLAESEAKRVPGLIQEITDQVCAAQLKKTEFK